MSRCDFEEYLAQVVAGTSLAGIGTDPIDVAMRDVADSPPDSDARADAIVVARLVFTQLADVAGDGIPWYGPSCPGCGAEMNAEVSAAGKLQVRQRCPQCDVVLLVPDPFAS